MKSSYAEDPRLRGRVFALLDGVFPGLSDAAAHAATIGDPWESVSTPFVHAEGGRIVAHVGVIELALVVAGSPLRVGSVHAVATHPGHRRRGHFGRLMAEVLREAEGRWDTLVLTTEQPAHYESFGFRVVPEHAFAVKPSPAADVSDAAGGGWRRLDLGEAGDVALLRRLLETRAPVSEVVGVVGDTAVFTVNEGRHPLWYSGDLDVVVCFEVRDGTLELFDVVGPRIPALGRLVRGFPAPFADVLVSFAPDRLEVDTVPVPRVLDHFGPSQLMVRGPFAAEARPFTLPRTART